MNYGPHDADVKDVLSLLGEYRLLQSCDLAHDPSVKVIDVLEEIERYRNLPAGIDPFSGALGWVDIRRTAGTGDHTILREVSNAIGPELSRQLDDLWDSRVRPTVIEQLHGVIDDDHAEDIAIDFEMIINFRAAFGRNVPFIERLVTLYRAGGYPCGWDGVYPSGRIVCYCPPATEVRSAS